MNKFYGNRLVIFSLVLPGMLTFLLAVLMPIILSGFYGLTDYNALGKAAFIGLANYKELAKDSVFWLSLRNSLLLAIGFIVIQHPLAMVTAAILDHLEGKAEGFFRCVYFIPNVISVAVIAYLWRLVYEPNFGLLNTVIKTLGGVGTINWLGRGRAIWSVLIVLIWHGFGWAMLIYYAGLKNISPELYEAASIDGCDGPDAFFRITLPLMRPVIQVNVTLAIISALKQMETVYLLTNGGPANETQFLGNYLYKQAFNAFRYGYGNAISVVFIIVCLGATLVMNRVFRDKEL
jgi:raffinose/stachyose/melibiose transport system permease protein